MQIERMKDYSGEMNRLKNVIQLFLFSGLSQLWVFFMSSSLNKKQSKLFNRLSGVKPHLDEPMQPWTALSPHTRPLESQIDELNDLIKNLRIEIGYMRYELHQLHEEINKKSK